MPDTDAESTTPEDAEVGEPIEASAEIRVGRRRGAGDDEEGDTFPRSYVEKLRRENANYRERARTADRYANGYTPNWSAPPAGWPTRPTSSSARSTSRTPTPWPATSTGC